jgi:hemolysin activation/secretion protein
MGRIIFLLLALTTLHAELKELSLLGTHSDLAELQQNLEATYVGEPLTLETIQKIKGAIIEAYRKKDRPVVAVDVPEQDLTEGTLELIITEGTIGEVLFTGNKWFSAKRMEKYVHLKPGDEINARTLSSDLFWINRNAFRKTDVVLTPGRLDGTTNLEFVTKDRFPLRPYVGADNTGIDTTGKGRVFTGFNWGDAFYLDQTLSYQFTKSTEWNRFFAHTANYNILLPWRNSITFYGGYSGVKPLVLDSRFKSTGRSWQASMRYDIPLPPFYNFLHELTIGADYKWTNNNMLFGQTPILIDGIAVITQAMLGYNLGYENCYTKIIFETEFYWSPGNLFAHQGLSSYNNLRTFATSHYIYTRSVLGSTFKLPREAALAFIFRGQWANENLLSSEQFGVGGYSTVRGYDERIINGDNAFLSTVELRSMPFGFTPTSCPNAKHTCEILGFFDYGIAINHKTPLDDPTSEFLMSIGPGVRYSIGTFVFVRFDWGYQLHHLPPEIEARHSKYHFSAIMSY